MFLYINSVSAVGQVALVDKHAQILASKKFSAKRKKSELVLGQVENLLHERHLPLKKITGIVVVTGPGPFTAVRIGLTVANTLAWTLGCKLTGVSLDSTKSEPDLILRGVKKLSKSKTRIAQPVYGQEPNISQPKKQM